MFIVFEGIDRCGKTTQCQALAQKLNQQVVQLEFPDRSTPVGKIIDEVLHNKVEMEDEGLHLLFAVNRWELKNRIDKLLLEGRIIVCDRYSFSGMAYSMAKGLCGEWCFQSEIGLPEPDVVIYLDISPEEASKRAGFGQEKFEKYEFQKVVYQSYDRVWKMLQIENLIRVDASRDCADISNEIYKKVLTIFSQS